MDWILTIFIFGANVWKKKKYAIILTRSGTTYFEYSLFLSDNNKKITIQFSFVCFTSWIIIATLPTSSMNLFSEDGGICVSFLRFPSGHAWS